MSDEVPRLAVATVDWRLDEMADMLASALARMGIETRRLPLADCADSSLTCVIFGWTWEARARRYVAVQTEQREHAFWHAGRDAYLAWLRGAEAVWTLWPGDVDLLREDGIAYAEYLHLGGCDALDRPPWARVPWARRSHDVLFYGHPNDRRSSLLAALVRAGITVRRVSGGLAGVALAEAAENSRIVLNLHFYPCAMIEVARIVPAVSRGSVVVSEAESPLAPPSFNATLERYVRWWRPDPSADDEEQARGLVAACRAVLDDPAGSEAFGYEAARRLMSDDPMRVPGSALRLAGSPTLPAATKEDQGIVADGGPGAEARHDGAKAATRAETLQRVTYGTSGRMDDVTALAWTSWATDAAAEAEPVAEQKGSLMVVPKGETARCDALGDRHPGALKHVELHFADGTTRVVQHDESVSVPSVGRPSWLLQETPATSLPRAVSLLYLDGGAFAEDAAQILLVTEFVPADARVLQIGAGLGRVSLTMAARMPQHGHGLVVLEPGPVLPYLVENRDRNGQNFLAIGAALSSRRTWILEGRTVVGEVQPSLAHAPVPTVTLTRLRRDLGARARFDAIVADCKGALAQILSEYPELLESVRAVVSQSDYAEASDKEITDAILLGAHFRLARSLPAPMERAVCLATSCRERFLEAWVRDVPAQVSSTEASL